MLLNFLTREALPQQFHRLSRSNPYLMHEQEDRKDGTRREKQLSGKEGELTSTGSARTGSKPSLSRSMESLLLALGGCISFYDCEVREEERANRDEQLAFIASPGSASIPPEELGGRMYIFIRLVYLLTADLLVPM